MSNAGFDEVEIDDTARAEQRRGRGRFSSRHDALDEPDFEVLADGADRQIDGDSGVEDPRVRRDRPDGPPPGHDHRECYACPVGVAYGAIRGVRPETTDRLANAIADLIEAAAGAFTAVAGEGRRARDGVQRVDIE